MGGRAAEELIFEDITTGAHNDIQQATRIARAMVTEYGMSESLGPVNLGSQGEVFLGKDYSQVQGHSEHTSQMVDREIRRLLEDAYAHAKKILLDNKHVLERIAKNLLEHETIGRDDFESMVHDLTPFSPNLSKA